jgi:hypothetical protein
VKTASPWRRRRASRSNRPAGASSSGYAIDLRGGLPPTTLPGGATEAILANNLSACELQYTPLPLLARGLVAVRLAITRANETVTLYYEAHVNNVP